jgi:allantoin racemase
MQSEQRIAILGTGFRPSGTAEPPPEIAASAATGFRPELIETRFGAFPSTQYDRGLAVIGNLDAGVTAAAAGYAALLLNTFGDYGLAELRSALAIPVVGAGEAALLLAASLGRRFVIVSIWPRVMNFVFEDRLAATGLAPRCAGIRNILDDDGLDRVVRRDPNDPVTAMRQGSAAIVDRIVRAAETAIDNDGADTVILGCTCMAPVAKTIAARLRAPVVEPMTAGYKTAELLVSLRLAQSQIAYPRPATDRLRIIADLVAGGPKQVEESCDVCVFAADAAAE